MERGAEYEVVVRGPGHRIAEGNEIFDPRSRRTLSGRAMRTGVHAIGEGDRRRDACGHDQVPFVCAGLRRFDAIRLQVYGRECASSARRRIGGRPDRRHRHKSSVATRDFPIVLPWEGRAINLSASVIAAPDRSIAHHPPFRSRRPVLAAPDAPYGTGDSRRPPKRKYLPMREHQADREPPGPAR